MTAKIIRINSILTAAMLFLFAGGRMLSLLLTLILRNTIFNLPTSVFSCLAVLLPTVLLLIYGIRQAKQGKGKTDMVLSVFTLAVSVVWGIALLLNWLVGISKNLITELYYRMDFAMSMGDLLSILNYLNVAYMLFASLVAIYLITVYVISVLRTKQRWLQIKAELHKPAVAALILTSNLRSLVQTLLSRIILYQVELGKMSLDVYAKFSGISIYGLVFIDILLALTLAVFVLIFGLIVKKQPDAKSATANEEQQTGEIPVDLPAGVDPKDL